MEANQPIQTTETPPPITPEEKSVPMVSFDTKSSSKNKSIAVVLVLLILGLLTLLVYLFYQNTQLRQQVELNELENPEAATCEYNGQTYEAGEGFTAMDGCNSCSCTETGEVACTAMACEENNKTSSDTSTEWKVYSSIDPKVTLSYPTNYVVSGRLASSLQNWNAGSGIAITDPTNPVQPRVLIEAVYDGYGPFFPTGTLDISFEGNQMRSDLVSTISDIEYQEMVANGSISGEETVYQSNIVNYNNIPIWVRITYNSKSNMELDEELMQILSTFEFTE